MSKYVLKRFGQLVKAIDQTNPKIEGHVRRIFNKLMHGIGCCYYEISFRSPSGGKSRNADDIILQTEWCLNTEQEGIPRHLIRDDHSYTDQTAYAYFESKELWIYAVKSGALLHTCTNAQQLRISGDSAEDIPPYRDPGDIEASKTSLLIPLKRNGFTIGVMCLEFPSIVEREGETKQFVKELAKIITSFFEKRAQVNRNLSETNDAFLELVEDLNFDSIRLPGDKLDIFFGYSHRADPDVIEAVENTIKEKHHEHIKLQSWKDIDTLGQITTNVCRVIGEADYALFYLSEPTPEEDKTALPYQDNANVLFECGIKHGKYGDSETGASRWLAIRETPEYTGAAPFDFSGHKMIHVIRNKDHKTDTETLSKELNAALEAMLKR